jgi:hypothetical protein
MAKDWQLTLKFSDAALPELLETQFSCPLLEEEIRGVRAHYPSGRCISIRWQKSTIALCVLALKIKFTKSLGTSEVPVLLGTKGSAAHVLANLLYIPKSPCDIFGYTSNGTPILRRMIVISNGRFENASIPIRVLLRNGVLSNVDSINVVIGERHLQDADQLLNLCAYLESRIISRSSDNNVEQLSLAA